MMASDVTQTRLECRIVANERGCVCGTMVSWGEEQCHSIEHRAVRKAQPNMPLKLTPLRGLKIGAFLESGIKRG
jgi:hypothetical protein